MEALRTYVSTAYKNNIEYMNILFTEIKKPTAPESDAHGYTSRIKYRYSIHPLDKRIEVKSVE